MANNEQINMLISQLASRLGTDAGDVKSAVENGSFEKVLKNMDSAQAQKISGILSDPEQSKKILSSPQVRALIKKLMG